MTLFGKPGETLKKGDVIPSFTLKDQDGKPVNLPQELGEKGAVIYFYPKDDSPVCTKEACAFRDHFEEFTSAGIRVIGINSGSVESHKKFGQKHHLPFTLLSDPDNKILKQFGIKNMLFLTGRETFVVDKQGIILHKFRDFIRAGNHIKEALQALELLR
ncbi:peroxiredoxin [Sinomicrobium sp. M5D2P9]